MGEGGEAESGGKPIAAASSWLRSIRNLMSRYPTTRPSTSKPDGSGGRAARTSRIHSAVTRAKRSFTVTVSSGSPRSSRFPPVP